MTAERVTLQEWLDGRDARTLEGEHQVIAACACDPSDGGYESCSGWVRTGRAVIYPCETVLTDGQRAEVGLPVPDPWGHLNEFL